VIELNFVIFELFSTMLAGVVIPTDHAHFNSERYVPATPRSVEVSVEASAAKNTGHTCPKILHSAS